MQGGGLKSEPPTCLIGPFTTVVHIYKCFSFFDGDVHSKRGWMRWIMMLCEEPYVGRAFDDGVAAVFIDLVLGFRVQRLISGLHAWIEKADRLPRRGRGRAATQEQKQCDAGYLHGDAQRRSSAAKSRAARICRLELLVRFLHDSFKKGENSSLSTFP